MDKEDYKGNSVRGRYEELETNGVTALNNNDP